MKSLILLTLLFSMNAYAIDRQEIVSETVKYIQPNITNEEANEFSLAILRESDDNALDWRLVASILAQESMFQRDPQNCLNIKRLCPDLGTGQINYKTWKNKLSLDRIKLLKDVNYNIHMMVTILALLHDQYGSERDWHTRYHSFTRQYRKEYEELVLHKYLIINAYSKGYSSGVLK